MLALAVETSCDETAVALVESGPGSPVRVVCEEVSSQTQIHELYGGVVPELAAREHLRNLPLMFDALLRKAGLGLRDIDLIAATRGPGLKGCLLIGLDFAKGVALAKERPLLGVNHIEGHVLVPMLDNPELRFPYLALIVSGGHTEIVEARGVGDYTIVARTNDDAAGEAFDKSANLLGLSYPGGAKLAALADSVEGEIPKEFSLPSVMRSAEGFSFSGLKTAIALLVKRQQKLISENPAARAFLAKSIQNAIVSALIDKVERALERTGIMQVAISGGVSANRALREAANSLPGVKVYHPNMLHCMDNAAMIGYTALLRFSSGERNSLEIGAISRWPVEEMRIRK